MQNVRRDALGLLAGASLAWAQAADAAKQAAAPPPPPPTGACSDCVGEIDSTLNACNLTSPSCVSSQNEDESHFEAPWQYEGSQKAAVKRLIKAVTGSSPAHLEILKYHQRTSKVRADPLRNLMVLHWQHEDGFAFGCQSSLFGRGAWSLGTAQSSLNCMWSRHIKQRMSGEQPLRMTVLCSKYTGPHADHQTISCIMNHAC